MKWIKNRNIFLAEEAKIRDVIFKRQAEEVKQVWGERWLELEEVELTPNIEQGQWKLSEEDKIEVLGTFFMVDLAKIYEFFNSLPDKLNEIIKLSVSTDLYRRPELAKVMENFDVKKPSVDQICILTEPVFRKISISETQATEIMVKDENGRPVMGEDGRPQKRTKEKGEVIFTRNLVNIISFVDDYNRLFPDSVVSDPSQFRSGQIQTLISTASDIQNPEYKVDYNIYSRDMFLSIKHNPKDILNMSISRYYASCQHLYSGGYRNRLLGNVFDPNSVPAYIMFDTPIMWNDEKISDTLPLCRMMIRNIESFSSTMDKTPKIFFDRAYPDRMKTVMGEMISKYSKNKETTSSRIEYLFTPDIPSDYDMRSDPYMDRLHIRRGQYIGANTKALYLSSRIDWSKVKIAPNAKIEEIVIETTNIPENLLSVPLKPKWIKFKFMILKDLTVFKNIDSDSFAFDKCKMTNEVLAQIKETHPKISNLQLTACDIKGLDLSVFSELEELQLIYTVEDKLEDVIMGVNMNSFIVSSDVLQSKENKEFVSNMKKAGIKVQIVGPKI